MENAPNRKVNLDTLVSHDPYFEKLNNDQVSRSIVVSGIPMEARETDLYIHFQSRRHGGGDIEHVRVIGDGTAVVTFNDEEGWLIIKCNHLLQERFQ